MRCKHWNTRCCDGRIRYKKIAKQSFLIFGTYGYNNFIMYQLFYLVFMGEVNMNNEKFYYNFAEVHLYNAKNYKSYKQGLKK
jgi:hypothetical protein